MNSNKALRRAAILYGCTTKLSNAHKPVWHDTAPPESSGAKIQPDYFVRMKIVRSNYDDLSRVLDLAKPMEGETVLNTVWI